MLVGPLSLGLRDRERVEVGVTDVQTMERTRVLRDTLAK